MTTSDKLREIAESSFVNISDEMKYIQKLLPDHYRCEQRGNGVRCISDIGINEVTEEGYWRVFIIALKVRYRDRFMEVFHQTCSDHKEFTVYIKEQSMADKLSAFAEKWSTEIAGNYDDELDVVTMLTNEDELLSDLTALISEHYYTREFLLWFHDNVQIESREETFLVYNDIRFYTLNEVRDFWQRVQEKKEYVKRKKNEQ